MKYRKNQYGFLTNQTQDTRSYWVYVYDGAIVSPLLTGGYNAVCRWIWEVRPDIASDAFLFKLQNYPDDFMPNENCEILSPGWHF